MKQTQPQEPKIPGGNLNASDRNAMLLSSDEVSPGIFYHNSGMYIVLGRRGGTKCYQTLSGAQKSLSSKNYKNHNVLSVNRTADISNQEAQQPTPDMDHDVPVLRFIVLASVVVFLVVVFIVFVPDPVKRGNERVASPQIQNATPTEPSRPANDYSRPSNEYPSSIPSRTPNTNPSRYEIERKADTYADPEKRRFMKDALCAFYESC